MAPYLDARSDTFFMLLRALWNSAASSDSASISIELKCKIMLPLRRFLFVKILLRGLSPPPPPATAIR